MRQIWTDEYYMRMALDLALRGMGKTTPNPLVGCVLVKDGKVVGRGWHDHLGGLHAEAAALVDAGERAKGATAYVTLEPCSHQGRQPPCAPALVRAEIARCVCAIGDPNPKVSGRGLNILRDAGIETVCGVLADEAAWMNRGFLSLQTRARPWVTLKAAVSADGSMCLANGESRWVTGAAARAAGQLLRSENDAILTGSGTLEHDDPALTVRDVEGVSPRPVILCRDLRCLSKNYNALNERSIVFGGEGAAVPDEWSGRVFLVPETADGALDLEALPEPAEGLAGGGVPAFRERLVPDAVAARVRGADGEPGRRRPVLRGHDDRRTPLRDRAQLAREIEADAREVLEERIHAEQRRALDAR
ncbi:MAG: bifunctional diaminohydroxyphosphoribosylaminopyrimidine deaminase/5-amino-6-(5-phosphoribosylamino)uracil reductase RibD, partial [Pyramidobacter sp.]|nr:bifunctional diaminohydroxyphosphoribosylaminopyrimidine deaminase/5-amino-6-(5-phosphoribosylamino)uracil reductase RibD [Pyramidobacter sp.]